MAPRKSDAEKRDLLLKQLKETKDYDTVMAHLANQRIPIALSDGVLFNYKKVQSVDDEHPLKLLKAF